MRLQRDLNAKKHKKKKNITERKVCGLYKPLKILFIRRSVLNSQRYVFDPKP